MIITRLVGHGVGQVPVPLDIALGTADGNGLRGSIVEVQLVVGGDDLRLGGGLAGRSDDEQSQHRNAKSRDFHVLLPILTVVAVGYDIVKPSVMTHNCYQSLLTCKIFLGCPMATLDSTMLDYEKPDAMRYLRVHGPMHRAALGMLLTGKPDSTDPAVKQFVNFANQQDMNIDECWAACHLDLIQASLLLVPSAGKTCMAFMSSVPARKHVQTMGKLVANACQVQDGKQTRIIQALLEANQRFELLALEEAGFKHLAHLIYMQRYVTASDRTSEKLNLGDNITVYNWSENNRQRFADAILASYVDTLDCPALLGVRDINDVIAGHMAAGEFDPSRWFALYDGDTPLGVMLLNRIAHRSALELVYLGLAPAARGQGLGKKLMQHAMNITAQHNACQILMAVDQENQPARKLYQRMGFARGEKKTAMIYILDEKQNASASCDVSA
ncbi:MAG: hypothetical protein CMJ19_13640 [Phycisphaeraceae bacterium]|nr:hypothetical protein [Phycisphaeraceae bacterium]